MLFRSDRAHKDLTLTMERHGEDVSDKTREQMDVVTLAREFWPSVEACLEPAFRVLAGLHAAGRLRYRETVAEGIESAPEAFFGLLKGRNFGKQLVRLVAEA